MKKQKDLYVFVDYEKASDMVKPEELILNRTKVKGEDLRLIKSLCWKQTVTIWVETKETEETCKEKGVRQGSLMSPDFFTLHGEIILREVQSTGGITDEASSRDSQKLNEKKTKTME